MEQLPYRSKTITTPVGETTIGKELDTKVRRYDQMSIALMPN